MCKGWWEYFTHMKSVTMWQFSDPVSLHPFTRISDYFWCADMYTQGYIVVVRRYGLWDNSFVCGCCKDWRKEGEGRSLQVQVCVWLGDEELTQTVSSLPSRESLQGFKMFPLDFEKVWHRYIVHIHMYNVHMSLHNNTHSHEVSLMGEQRNWLQHQNVTKSVPKLSRSVSWDRGV